MGNEWQVVDEASQVRESDPPPFVDLDIDQSGFGPRRVVYEPSMQRHVHIDSGRKLSEVERKCFRRLIKIDRQFVTLSTRPFIFK